MRAFTSSFDLGWWSFDLGDLRLCDGTYELYAFADVPDVASPDPDGDYDWLRESAGEPSPCNGDLLEDIRLALEASGLTLPPAFEVFMGDAALQDAVPSCTGCEWDLGDVAVPCAVEPGAFTVRFLRDQQDCLFWYLYLAPGKAPQVVCSPIHFDKPEGELTVEAVRRNTVAAADDFEAFVYRWWLENELWEIVNDDPDEEDLSPEQAAYLRFYRERTH
jgi:hypothetical protein